MKIVREFMPIKGVYWGGRRSGKTTMLLEQVKWSTAYIGHGWRQYRERLIGVDCRPYTRGVSFAEDRQTFLLDDIESWHIADLAYMLSMSDRIDVYITFTPPPRRLTRDNLLVQLVQFPEARWTGSAIQHINERELARYKQELPRWHYKTQMEGKILLGADTSRR
jgi:hypothetical protein